MKTGAILFIEDYFLDKEPSEILRELGKDYIAWDDLPTKEGKDLAKLSLNMLIV